MASLPKIRPASRYQEIYDRGKKFKQPFFIGYFLANGSEQNNYGFVASRRVGGAVIRNRARRLLREACRRARELAQRIRPGRDIVLVARSAIKGAGCAAVYDQWLAALAEAGKGPDRTA